MPNVFSLWSFIPYMQTYLLYDTDDCTLLCLSLVHQINNLGILSSYASDELGRLYFVRVW